MSKRAAVYVRVSTDEQKERGYSLPSQVEACTTYAMQLGFDVVGVFQDDVSGMVDISQRPGGGELQKMIARREIEAVVIYDIDRLSRDLINLLVAVKTWLACGLELYSRDVGRIESYIDILLVFKGLQGGTEHKKIIERTNRGRWRKASEGKAVGSGTPPYGYTYSDGELTPKEPEAGVVRLIYKLYVEGDETGRHLGVLDISRRLTEVGIPTPSESKGWKTKRKRLTGQWDSTSIFTILKSETYCGVLRYGKFIGNRGRGGMRPESEQIKIDVPPIISRETWQAAQEQRAKNARLLAHKTKHPFLLRGMAFCECGYSLAGSRNNYRCLRKYQNSSPCDEPPVKTALLDGLVLEYVYNLIKDPATFEQNLRKAQALELTQAQPKQDELGAIIELIKQAEEDAEEIAQTIKGTRGIVRKKLEQDSEEVDARYNALCARRDALTNALSETKLNEDVISDMLEFRADVEAGLSNPTIEGLRAWFELLGVRVVVGGGMATITCRISPEKVCTPLITSKNSRILLRLLPLQRRLDLKRRAFYLFVTKTGER
ncbi:MAG TPA: recombinase family protein [Anaerolineales bacterium]|nr:recombinase family protein [Anaerolineales bacterium]